MTQRISVNSRRNGDRSSWKDTTEPVMGRFGPLAGDQEMSPTVQREFFKLFSSGDLYKDLGHVASPYNFS